jgi:hypothetical protein
MIVMPLGRMRVSDFSGNVLMIICMNLKCITNDSGLGVTI